MKKSIICIFTALSILVSIIPVTMAENEEIDIMPTDTEEMISEDIQELDIELDPVEENDEEESYQLASDSDFQLFSTFTQRTGAPNRNSDYWYKSGVNPLAGIYANGNCTWYAWGRASEILGSALPAVAMTRTTNVNNGNSRTSFRGNAWSWWYDNLELNSKGSGYPSGQTPAVGAIAIWGACSTNSSGHVAIVEDVNGDDITITESSYGGVWYTGGNWGRATYTTNKLKYGQTNKKVVMPFLGFIYISGNSGSSSSGGSSAPVHTHTWQAGYENAHPHRQFRKCSSCDATEYTGGTQHVSSCSSCYPVGNVNLTRSFERTQKYATFYRNAVSNANSYTLTLYRNGSQYGTYDMSSSQKTINGLPSGTYYATLTAKNNNTGQSRSNDCYNFTLVDTYRVSFNANGGTNAPSAQTKIQDENLTLTSSKPTRAHYIFKGWASSKTATEPQYEAGSYYTKNTPITLYAVWEPETYTIKFDMNSGMGTADDTTITYGDTMKMPNTVVRESYYLKGWAKNKNATNPNYRIGIDYALDENMTLYAVWGNSTWGGTVATGFAGGDGTEQNPYQISNAGELAYLAQIVNEQSSAPEYKYYVLTDNINLGFREWKPIGLAYNDYQHFYGSFDGNGYTISDLLISEGNEGSIGLFGKAKNSEIKNLNIYGEISGMTLSNTAYIGAVVGNADNTNVSGCNALYVNISDISNTATTYSYMGAICGYASGTISDCGAEECYIGLKDGYSYGGVIGGYIKGIITDVTIQAEEGLFGSNAETDNLYLGGVCGYLDGNAEKCIVSSGFLSNNLRAKTAYIGGIVGYLTGTVNLCASEFHKGTAKNIDGSSYQSSISVEGNNMNRIGGISGYIEKGGKITNCKYDGQSISSTTTSGSTNVGGIAGRVCGNETAKITAQGGQSLSRSSLPTRNGYTATWYTDTDLTKEYDFSQPVTDNMTLYAKWTEGGNDIEIWDGTSEEPEYDESIKTYTITNGKELAWISDVTNGVITSGTNFPANTLFEGYTIELANDIYLNDISDVENWGTTAPANEWKTICDSKTDVFLGSLNGCNKSIVGIYLDESSNIYSGLIGFMGGNIYDLNVVNGYIKTTLDAGSICGYAKQATISNCKSNIKFISNQQITASIGGIVGVSENSTIAYSANLSDISVLNSSSNGGGFGGIVGKMSNYTYLNHCYNTGCVQGGQYVGGIAGRSDSSSVTYCYSTGSIAANCSFNGAASGGIVGEAQSSSISYSHNTGNVASSSPHLAGTASNKAGGICGLAVSSPIAKNYSTGDFSGGEEISASVVGLLNGTSSLVGRIQNCYAIKSPLYNTRTSDYVGAVGSSTKTATAMKTLSNLSGFSTDDWAVDSTINDGYPYLKSLEDTYKIYNITVIDDPENTALLNKCFVNVDGIICGTGYSQSLTGGAIGYASYKTSDYTTAPVNNLLVIADRVSAIQTGITAPLAFSSVGKIVGYNIYDNAIEVNNATTYSEMETSVVHPTNDAYTNEITGIERPLSQIKQARILQQIFGPNTYQSLADLEEHPDAVWVVKSGQLPDLYYNLLRNINISETVNGTISVDKAQAVDDEIVTVTATPSEGYQLNKIYVNGEEIAGTTFEVNGDCDVYATFIEETPEYNVRITATDNASASLVNVDAVNLSGFSLMAANDNLTATDGDEIKVNTAADEEYTVDAVYVNGEELAGDSFIITENSVVTMDVKSISTDIKATTGDATDIGGYFATLSGSVEGDENTVRYIRYWSKDNPDEVFTTEPEDGSGEYSFEVNTLIPETEYEYQMGDTGEIRSFTTLSYYLDADSSAEDDPDAPGNPTPTDEPVMYDYPAFEIKNQQLGTGSISLDIQNNADDTAVGTLIIAVYDSSNSLVTVKTKAVANIPKDTSKSFDVDVPEAAYFKLFIWKDIKSMLPMADSVTIR